MQIIIQLLKTSGKVNTLSVARGKKTHYAQRTVITKWQISYQKECRREHSVSTFVKVVTIEFYTQQKYPFKK